MTPTGTGTDAWPQTGRPPVRGITAAARLAIVQRAAEQLAAAHSVGEIADVLASAIGPALGASAVSIGILDESGQFIRILLAKGFSEETEEMLREPQPVAGSTMVAKALAEQEMVLYSTVAERDALFPELVDVRPVTESAAILPLVVQGRSTGLMTVAWAQRRRFGRADRALLQLMAHQCAVALDRARIDRLRRAERETLELLSQGTRLMVSKLDPGQVIESLVHLAVPRLAPWCAVYVPEGDEVRRVAIEVAEEAALAARLRGQLLLTPEGAADVRRVLETGEPVVVPYLDADSVPPESRQGSGEPIVRLLSRARRWTSLVVPITAAGQTIGAMSMVSPHWEGSPSEQVRFAAEGLAARAGVAMVNARRFEQERSITSQLVSALLPAVTPEIPGFQIAARYRPAGAGIAGDWFDAMALPGGAWLFGIGDAGGHGIPAASLMAQLRNGARGLAVAGAGPGAILHGLDTLTALDHRDSFATATYARLEHDGSLRWASAGHVPPLVFGPRRCRFLDDPTGSPLGAPDAGPPPEHVLSWGPGQGVVLVTDGLVERRGSGIDEGMAALASVVGERTEMPAEELAQAVIDGVGQGAEDDCCVMVIRRDR